MQKRNVFIFFILSLTLTNLVSAYYGSYRSFSLRSLLDSIDPSTLLLVSVFIIAFAILNFALSRTFKDHYGNPNRAVSGSVSLVISLLIMYGINTSNFNLENFFYDIGINQNLLSTLVPIILIGGGVFIIWRLGLRWFFFISGIGLILISTLTNWVYERGLVLVIGIVSTIIGLVLLKRKRKKDWRYYLTKILDGRGH